MTDMPIVAHGDVALDAKERERLRHLANDLSADEPALSASGAFGPWVSPGLGPWPSLVIEDHSWITLFEERGDAAYSYRALLLAGDGDLVVMAPPRCLGFEDYCRNVLGLGHVEILTPAASAKPLALAQRCADDAVLVGRAANLARRSGGLNVVPYMGTGGVWMLARRVAKVAQVPVHVAAPMPRLTRRVNDKTWFTARVGEVLGTQAAPVSKAVYNLAALAGQVAALARQYRCVAIKIPDSASSAGNIIMESQDIREMALRHLRDTAASSLRSIGWQGAFPLMVTAWEEPILGSPSAQIWIPDRRDGLPVLEGLFDQMVIGPAREFGGAAESALPKPWRHRLAQESVRLACVFQELGYFGRCSFDSIIVGEDLATASLHWVECNGRWGGVSIPMTLANRLIGDWTRRPPVIIDRANLPGAPRSFDDVLAELDADLFKPGVRETGAVIISPSRLQDGSGYEIMVLGKTVAAAKAHAEDLAAGLAPKQANSTPRPEDELRNPAADRQASGRWIGSSVRPG
jgi:hypothetical protein